jgi:NADH-quinone oxidoreductase subunit A
MNNVLLAPPIAFIILLLFISFFSSLLSRISFHVNKDKDRSESKKAYACGEEFSENMIQPDYSQFFPFAFFFTILHVVALMIATVSIMTIGALTIAMVYILGAVIGLVILLRK